MLIDVLPGSGVVRSTIQGPWSELPAWRGEGEFLLASPVGESGTVSLWFRLPNPIRNGPGVEAGAATVLALPGVGAVKVWWYSGYMSLLWEVEGGQPTLAVELPGLPGGQWIHAFYTWDAAGGRLEGCLNGTPLRVGDFPVPPWKAGVATQRIVLGVPAWSIAGLRVTSSPLPLTAALEEVPSIFHGALDHSLGRVTPPTLKLGPYAGTLFPPNPLASARDVAGWRMEGPGAVSFHDGWMRLASETPSAPGADGHIVFWSDQELPSDFLMEFEVRILSDTGLNILFFAAKGCRGEDVFAPDLQPRTGIFGQYLNGDIDCYHVSYYADTPDVRGRPTSNLRKNKGFYLVDNGPVGIPPGSRAIHRVAICKAGGRIHVAVDNKCVLDWTDDGVQYGPVLGAGKFAFRQMKWTVAEYRNLQFSQVLPAS